MPSDLDAAIRERLELHRAADIVADGARGLLRAAIQRVLDRCERMETSGDPLMVGVAHAIRTDIARELNVTEEVGHGD